MKNPPRQDSDDEKLAWVEPNGVVNTGQQAVVMCAQGGRHLWMLPSLSSLSAPQNEVIPRHTHAHHEDVAALLHSLRRPRPPALPHPPGDVGRATGATRRRGRRQ